MSALNKFSSAVVFIALLTIFKPYAFSDDWLPVTPDELKLASEPKAPGAAAIYLYRQVDRDDVQNHETTYARIKIFTDEGRKYADMEIPFFKGEGDIKGIQARTIRPDGSILNFDGKVYEKMIVKARGLKYLAKTFSLPNVQVGSIIEYRFTRHMQEGFIFDSSWLLSEELFTKHAKFSLHRSPSMALRWSWPRGLPEGTHSPVDDHHMIRLEVDNVPAFQIEDYMPPQHEVKLRVDFTYTRNEETNVDKFWKEEGKKYYRGIEIFTDHQKAMEQAVSQIVAPADPSELKLQKIYAHTQQIRNTTFEDEKTAQERNRNKQKDVYTVEDVWKRGYGNGYEITWLFLALARAAGFDAKPVLLSTRDEYFFQEQMMQPDQLNTNAVLIKINGQDMYFDPGSKFVPYGMLPWAETAVRGLVPNKEGANWITTAVPNAAESGIVRKAMLRLTDEGSLEGKATITFSGLSAWWRRADERSEDDAQRKKFLEDEVKEFVPVAVDAELTNKPEWNSSAPQFVAEFDIKVPGWSVAAGRRVLLPIALFGGSERHIFEHDTRLYPIIFTYPYQDTDDVTIELPQGWHIDSVPPAKNIDQKACNYHVQVENKGGAVHLTRQLSLNFVMLDPKYYGALRNFYQQVRTGDDQQAVLSTGAQGAQNSSAQN